MKPCADCAKKCPPKAIKAPFKPFFGAYPYQLCQTRKNPPKRALIYRFVSILRIRAIVA
jgi:hypothetical protein